MPRMRACASVNAVLLSALGVAVLFGACTSAPPPGPPVPATPDPTSAPETPPEPAAPGPGATGAAPAGPKKQPETVADCKNLATEITNDPPDGGVVMNNAQTAADAGASDRFAPMVELMKQKRDAFRCCFDIWAKKNGGGAGKVTFVFQLEPAGKLRKGFVKADESTLNVPELEACMVEVAKGLEYPKSPSGKDTEYTHRFEFKVRR